MKSEWKQLLLIAGFISLHKCSRVVSLYSHEGVSSSLEAGGAAATGVALYYLLRDDGSGRKEKESEVRKLSRNDATKEQVLMVLRDILSTQEKMKGLMKKFTQKFFEEECTFEEACAMVAKQHPEDPLGRYGLTMATFDGLLDKFQQDPEVKEAVLSIMGSASTPNPTPAAYQISTDHLIKVHEFMRDELQSLAAEAGSWPKADIKVITLAAQAYVGAKVQKKFGLTGEDIEGAVLLNHKDLSANANFTLVNMAIQKTMNDLVDADA
ncbi:hypothetical protein, conserved [Eimeria necatrix]|uniref:Uncharacterized protein n=1 Tax=Eimeria necatrix TaxID=51315 RepID=U6MR14_9EIME|nr:hypothetical protein, conserved [Eimeria necatrix]CDJ64075.1 hypothetical protein, conserved [Eimeria necatrix]